MTGTIGSAITRMRDRWTPLLRAFAHLGFGTNGQTLITTGSALQWGTPQVGRELLTGARTYYVRTGGSDSNTGLVNNDGGAFQTVQKAIDVAASLDTSIYDVTIQIAAGTYTTSVGLVAKQCVGAGSIIIVGDETTPSNVVLATNGTMAVTDGGIVSAGISTVYKLRGVQLSSSASGASRFAFLVYSGAYLEFQKVDFGAGWTQHITVQDQGLVRATGNYSISSGAAIHKATVAAAIRIQGFTITLTGTPAFSSGFAFALRCGVIFAATNTYSGSATGPRYSSTENGVISVGGGGANYFPGNSAGATATGGQYN